MTQTYPIEPWSVRGGAGEVRVGDQRLRQRSSNSWQSDSSHAPDRSMMQVVLASAPGAGSRAPPEAAPARGNRGRSLFSAAGGSKYTCSASPGGPCACGPRVGVLELTTPLSGTTRSANNARCSLPDSIATPTPRSPPRRCDREQHVAHPRQSSGGSRVDAVHCGSPVFFEHADDTIRAPDDWERDEVLLQMLSWQAAPAGGVSQREEPAES